MYEKAVKIHPPSKALGLNKKERIFFLAVISILEISGRLYSGCDVWLRQTGTNKKMIDIYCKLSHKLFLCPARNV